MIAKNLHDETDEERFVAWLITQTNTHGRLYLKHVAWQYARYLRTQPPKLNIALSLDERNVYACKTVNRFESLYKVFISAPNFKGINLQGHQTFSAGLSAYRRYVQYIDENGESEMQEQEITAASAETSIDAKSTISAGPQRVDFAHPELCKRTDPYSCRIGFDEIRIRKTWIDLFVDIVEYFMKTATKKISTYKFKSGRPLLIDKALLNLNCKTLSNGKVIIVNYDIPKIVLIIGKICTACGVSLNTVSITYVSKAGVGGETPVLNKDESSSRFTQPEIRSEYRAWLIDNNPDWSEGTVNIQFATAYYLYNHERGVTLAEALTSENGMQRAYDAIEQFYVSNPTQSATPAASARWYIHSLRKFKLFLEENHPELLTQSGNTAVVITTVPDTLIKALNSSYSSGFRFETTYVNLLSNASGVEIDEKMLLALKRIMFHRDDDVYFLLDVVANAATQKDVVNFADSYLQEYGCFEIPELYKLYADKLNSACIRNTDDFERFYEQISKGGVRCVQAPYIGNRIARYSNGSVWVTFKEVAARITAVIRDEYCGSCNEEDLHTKFSAFSTDLLGKIIKQAASDDLIRVEINDSVCYQTYDALGLPENFSEQLAETLERLNEIGLPIYRDALHTALSLKLGVNFMAEFNLPDWDTFQRLTAAFYKAQPRREWKHNIFGEVQN